MGSHAGTWNQDEYRKEERNLLANFTPIIECLRQGGVINKL